MGRAGGDIVYGFCLYLWEDEAQSWQVLERSSCVLQTPILLTPSPLLSSIHFWSTLSPFAPLSPARLQGANTLFQVSYPKCASFNGGILSVEMGRSGSPLPSVIATHLPCDDYFTLHGRILVAFPFGAVGEWGLSLSVAVERVRNFHTARCSPRKTLMFKAQCLLNAYGFFCATSS